jgi:hypothetical protein
MGVKKLKQDISNKYSIIGLVVGLLATILLGFIGLAIVIIIMLIIYFVTDKSKDDLMNFVVFALIGFVIGVIINILIVAAIWSLY